MTTYSLLELRQLERITASIRENLEFIDAHPMTVDDLQELQDQTRVIVSNLALMKQAD